MNEAQKIFFAIEGNKPFPQVAGGQLIWGLKNQQRVGFIYVKPIDMHEAEIIYIGVLPQHHKQGVGQFLLHAAQQRYPKLYLEVETTNTPACKLYEKMGFTIQRTRPHYYGEQRHAFDMMWIYSKENTF